MLPTEIWILIIGEPMSNGNLIYDIYDDIDYWESQYESAPETRNLVEGRPAVGVQTYSNTGEVMGDNAFTGIAQLDDGSQYSYRTSSWGGLFFGSKNPEDSPKRR